MTELRIALLNARTAAVVDFGSGFVVRPATASEQSRWADDPFVRDVVPHRVLPEIRSVLVCSGRGSYPPDRKSVFEEELMVWFGLTSLCTRRLVEASFCEEWYRANDENNSHSPDGGKMLGSVRYFRLALPVAEAPPWKGPIQLDAVATFLKDQLPLFRSNHPYTNTFRYALARWYASQNKYRRTLEDAVLDLSIALEALFIVDVDTHGISSLMRERISEYWCGKDRNGKELRTIQRHVNNIYDIRSRIVHGEIVEETRLSEARNILDEIARTVLQDFATGKLSDFDPTTYWMPRGDPGDDVFVRHSME